MVIRHTQGDLIRQIAELDNMTSSDNACDEHDDYCDKSEECDSASVDCIDDRNFDEDDYDG